MKHVEIVDVHTRAVIDDFWCEDWNPGPATGRINFYDDRDVLVGSYVSKQIHLRYTGQDEDGEA